MTIELAAPHAVAGEHHEEIVQFLFRSTTAPGLAQRARALLDAAPKEVSDSFEQAMRTAGIAS